MPYYFNLWYRPSWLPDIMAKVITEGVITLRDRNSDRKQPLLFFLKQQTPTRTNQSLTRTTRTLSEGSIPSHSIWLPWRSATSAWLQPSWAVTTMEIKVTTHKPSRETLGLYLKPASGRGLHHLTQRGVQEHTCLGLCLLLKPLIPSGAPHSLSLSSPNSFPRSHLKIHHHVSWG